MRPVLLSLLIVLNSCVIVENEKKEQIKETPEKGEYFLARVTFYTDDPKWGKKTASGKIADQGTTVAAAKRIPYNTKYYIPRLKNWIDTDGFFKVHDRGPWVCRRVASNGKYPVIDVYVSSANMVRKLGRKSENIFKVYYE